MRTCGFRSDSAAAAGSSDRLFGNPCFYFFWFPWTSLGRSQEAWCEHVAFAQIPRRRRAGPTDFSEIRVFICFGSRRLAWADLRKRCVKMLLSLRFRGGCGQGCQGGARGMPGGCQGCQGCQGGGGPEGGTGVALRAHERLQSAFSALSVRFQCDFSSPSGASVDLGARPRQVRRLGAEAGSHLTLSRAPLLLGSHGFRVPGSTPLHVILTFRRVSLMFFLVFSFFF